MTTLNERNENVISRGLVKGYLYIPLVYAVLYVNYFVEHSNIHNVTITLLWINTIFFLFGAIGSLYSKDKYKPQNNSIIRIIKRILMLSVPLIMIYFGDIFMGIIYGTSLLITIIQNNIENG